MPGRRLVYSVGILWLAAMHPVMAAILVLLAFLFFSYRQTLRHSGPDLAVVTVPWAREEPHPEEVIKEEEPGPEAPATAKAEHV